MRVVPTHDTCKLDLTGHTLVLPGAGGMAHLGELAVDALVTSFGLSRVAFVQTPLLLPMAMSSIWRPAKSQQTGRLELTTAAELYQSDAVPGLSVLQMRSPPAEGRRRALAKDLCAWASSVGVSQIVVVSPCAAYMREDADITSTSRLRFAHLGLSGSDNPAQFLEKAGLDNQVLALSSFLPPCSEEEEVSNENRDLVAVQRMLHGGGLTRPLLYEAHETVQSAFCLLAFASATVDLRVLEQLTRAASAVLAVKLGIQAPVMKFPPSWDFEAEAQAPQLPSLLG